MTADAAGESVTDGSGASSRLLTMGTCRRCRVAQATRWPFYCASCYAALWSLAVETAPLADALERWRSRPLDVAARRLGERLAELLELTFYADRADAGPALAALRTFAREADVVLGGRKRRAA